MILTKRFSCILLSLVYELLLPIYHILYNRKLSTGKSIVYIRLNYVFYKLQRLFINAKRDKDATIALTLDFVKNVDMICFPPQKTSLLIIIQFLL